MTYVGTFNFRMEPITSLPLYSMAMLQFMITIVEAPFVSAPIHIVVGITSIPQTQRGTKFVNLREDMPK